MADIALSSKSTTAVVTGAYCYIIIPDGVSYTGFVGRRITVANLQAALQAQITANAGNISTNTSDISDLQDITSREQFTDEVGATFQFSQPANSIINYINLRSTGAATFAISGSVTGAIQTTTNLTDGVLYRLDKIVDSEPGQTITFTITGTVSAEIYYNKNTI